jgi:hypothetical protein
MHKQRRIVLKSISVVTAVTAAGIPISAFAALQKVSESDPQAVSLGYKDDTTKVDQAKFSNHTKSQVCSGCQFFDQTKMSGQVGPCSIFGGKGVAAKGWCSAYMKKSA